MLKGYLKEKGKSIYALAKESNIPYSTLNDLANGKVTIEQCKVELLLKLAKNLSLSMEEICKLCKSEDRIVHSSYEISPEEAIDVEAKINVRNKSYHAEFDYEGELVDIELCKVKEDTSHYIDEIAKWRTESYIRERRMEEWK